MEPSPEHMDQRMLEAAFWGFVGASALVIGAEIAIAFELSRLAIGLVMAFGVGTLIASIASGALAFFFGDRADARMGGAKRRDPDGGQEGGDDCWVRSLRWSIVGVATISAALGYWAISNSDEATGAFVQAFAAGALLTTLE